MESYFYKANINVHMYDKLDLKAKNIIGNGEEIFHYKRVSLPKT
jgi:hypothetical protein